jgi:hypothetical protein
MDKTTKSLTPAELKLKHELLHFCEPDPPEIFRHIQPVQPPSEKVLKKVRSGVHCTPRTGLWWTENRECVRARANTLEMFTSLPLSHFHYFLYPQDLCIPDDRARGQTKQPGGLFCLESRLERCTDALFNNTCSSNSTPEFSFNDVICLIL